MSVTLMVFSDRKLLIFFQKTWNVLFYGRKSSLRNSSIICYFFEVSYLFICESYNTSTFTSVMTGTKVSADISSVISLNFFCILCYFLFLFFLLFCFWDLQTDLFLSNIPLNISGYMSSFFFSKTLICSSPFPLVLSTELSFAYHNSGYNLVLVSHFQCYTIWAMLQYRQPQCRRRAGVTHDKLCKLFGGSAFFCI